jgi:hypothetical protein
MFEYPELADFEYIDRLEFLDRVNAANFKIWDLGKESFIQLLLKCVLYYNKPCFGRILAILVIFAIKSRQERKFIIL